MVLDHRKFKSILGASHDQVQNINQFFENHNHPIRAEEASFVDHEWDLVPVVSRNKAPLRRFLEKLKFIMRIGWFRAKKSRGHLEDDSLSETTVLNNDSKIEKVVTCTTMILGLGMLIGPLWWLQSVSLSQSNLSTRLLIITGFIVAFAVLLITVTATKVQKTLALTAAYAAVLMVFMQLGSRNNPPTPS